MLCLVILIIIILFYIFTQKPIEHLSLPTINLVSRGKDDVVTPNGKAFRTSQYPHKCPLLYLPPYHPVVQGLNAY